MRNLKNYQNYSEEYRLNENLLKNLLYKVINFFKEKFGKNAFAHIALFLKKKKQLPENKIKIHVPDSWLDSKELKEAEKELKLTESSDELKNARFKFVIVNEEFIQRHVKFNKLNEAFIDLKSTKGLKDYDVKELRDKIKRYYKLNVMRAEGKLPAEKRQSLFIWGAPGIGKTEILRQVAEELQIMVEEWILATIDPTDFRGVPYVKTLRGDVDVEGIVRKDIEEGDPNYTRTISALPDIFPTSNWNGKNYNGGVMFFDEINRAIPMVLGAALGLCLNGRMGRYELPSKWFVVAAGNRLEDLGNLAGTELEPALSNRFTHINYAPSFDSWSKWALSKPHMNPDIVGFLEFFRDYYHRLDPHSGLDAWPSPRQWELASIEHYGECDLDWDNKLSTAQIKEIYEGHVGVEAAVKFSEFSEIKNQYSVKDIQHVYKDGKTAKPLPARLDHAYACMTAIATYKRDKKLTADELRNIYDFALGFKETEKREPFMALVKKFHPYIATDSDLQKVRFDALKKWHNLTQEENKELQELEQQFKTKK